MILIWYVVDSVCLLKALHCFFNQQFANNKSLSVCYAKRMWEIQRGGDKRNAPFLSFLVYMTHFVTNKNYVAF